MKKILQNYIVDAFLLIILGAVLIVRPNGTLSFICRLFGVIFLVMGTARIAAFAVGSGKKYVSSCLIGVLQVVIGIAIFANTRFFLGIVPYLGGLVIIVSAVVSLVRQRRMRSTGKSFRATSALAGTAIVLGVVVMLNPASIAALITRIMGAALILVGVTMPFFPPEES